MYYRILEKHKNYQTFSLNIYNMSNSQIGFSVHPVSQILLTEGATLKLNGGANLAYRELVIQDNTKTSLSFKQAIVIQKHGKHSKHCTNELGWLDLHKRGLSTECIADCYHKFAFNWFHYLYYYQDKYNKYSNFNISQLNNNERKQLLSGCKNICNSQDKCDQQYYYAIDEPIHSNGFKYFYSLNIELPKFPTVIYEMSLKMSFEEYLSLTASIISLWFGFSIIMFTEFMQTLFTKLKFRNYIKNIFNKCNHYHNYCNVKRHIVNKYFINRNKINTSK